MNLGRTAMISEAKLAANRKNALRGGVKTREGRLKSRRNALKHGHRAEVVLPEDLQAEADARFHQLVDEIRPEGTIELGLARRMALELTKLQRLETEEHAALAARIREAGEAFDDQQQRRLDACLNLLMQQPARAVRGLLGFTVGCNWLLGQWTELRGRLEAGAWDEESALRTRVQLGGREPDGDLTAIIAEELEAVESERDAVWEELDGPLRQEAEDRALLDTSKEGEKRYRYEGQSVRQLHKAIDQCCKLRQGWSGPRAASRRRPAAPNEPTAEVLQGTILTATTSGGAATSAPVSWVETQPTRPAEMRSGSGSVPGAGEPPLGADPHPGPLPGGEGGRAPNEPTAEVLTSTSIASAGPARSAPRGEASRHGEPVVPQGSPALEAAVEPKPMEAGPAPRGGEVAPNEPTAEVLKAPNVPAQLVDNGSGIRRELFTEPAQILQPLVIDGIRVR
jgi:hypothetical protein